MENLESGMGNKPREMLGLYPWMGTQKFADQTYIALKKVEEGRKREKGKVVIMGSISFKNITDIYIFCITQPTFYT